MKKLYLVLLGGVSTSMAFGQTDTIPEGWRKGGVVSINFGHGASRNWAAGAEKWSVSLGTVAAVFANYKSGKWHWDNSLDLGYAFVSTESTGFRKTDDKIYASSKLGYALAPKLNASFLANLRTQFYHGYEYNYLGAGLKRRTSGFTAPAYVTLAPGLDWRPSKSLSFFVAPISLRWVLVTNDPYDYYFEGGVIPDSLKTPATGDFEKPKSVLYGVDPVKKVRLEAGAFASIQFNKEVVKNVGISSKLDLFSNFLKGYAFLPPDYKTYTRSDTKPQNIDVYWTNVIAMKVNKFLNVTYSFDIIYDDDVRQFGESKNSAATQFRSQLAVGFQAKL